MPVLGFGTREHAGLLGAPRHVAVSLPRSLNFAGQMVIVTRDRVEDVALASGEGMARVVSGGVTEVGAPGGGRGLPGQAWLGKSALRFYSVLR